MSNVSGFHSLAKDEKKDGVETFVGGGAKSSTAVYRPTGAGGGASDAIIRSARGQSAGGGPPPGTRDRTIATITLYKNGFQMEGGAFRDANDAKNQKFLDALKRSEVPAELNADIRRQWPKASHVGVNLVNKTQQTFVPPVEEKKYDFSKSKGLSLGGSSSSSSTGGLNVSSLSGSKYILDDDQPKTTIQIVLANRKRVRAQFNTTATVKQLFQHVKAISTMDNFKLMEGFPPKPLSGDLGRTLQEAKLIGTSVQQRAC